MTRLCLVKITFHNRCRHARSYFYLKSSLLQIAVLEAKIYKRIIEPQGFGRASWPAFNGPESCFPLICLTGLSYAQLHILLFILFSALNSVALIFCSTPASILTKNKCEQLAVTDNGPFPLTACPFILEECP